MSLSLSLETPAPTSLIFCLPINSERSYMAVLLITKISEVQTGIVFERVYVEKSS